MAPKTHLWRPKVWLQVKRVSLASMKSSLTRTFLHCLISLTKTRFSAMPMRLPLPLREEAAPPEPSFSVLPPVPF